MAQDLKTRILYALHGLGETRDEIHSSILKRGITGCEPFTQSCPIARYLKEVFLTDTNNVSVGPDTIVVGSAFLKTPWPIQDYIRWADNHPPADVFRKDENEQRGRHDRNL